MKVGLFFGSFNPIHIGHLIIADSLLSAAKLDDVWFVVSPQNPFKGKSGLAPIEQRIKWVKKCIASHPSLSVCDIETKLPIPSYTQQTLEALQKKYKAHDFHILMGSDSYKSLSSWKNAEEWMHHFPIEVYQRNGTEIKESITQQTNLHTLPLLPISSTEIRRRLKNQESIHFWVSEEVRDEVSKHYFQNR